MDFHINLIQNFHTIFYNIYTKEHILTISFIKHILFVIHLEQKKNLLEEDSFFIFLFYYFTISITEGMKERAKNNAYQ